MDRQTEFVSVSSTWNDVCRLCLDQANLRALENLNCDILSTITIFFEAFLEHNIPDNVCEKCFHELTRIAEFIGKCKNSNEVLQQFEEHCEKLKNYSEVEIEILHVEDLAPIENILIQKENVDIHLVNGDEREFKKSENSCTGVTAKDFQLDSEETALELPLQDIEDNTCFKGKDVKPLDLSKRCQKCGQIIGTMGTHYKESKNCRPRNIKCAECSMVFTTTLKLKIHMTSHHWKETDPRFMCHVCGNTFKYEVNLKRHLRSHKVGKQFICEKCGKGYTTKIHLDDHMNLHTGSRPHTCCYCDKAFRLRGVRERHQKRHLKTMLHVRPVFTKSIIQPESILDIMFACDTCNRIFASEKSLNLHKGIHDNKFKCDCCGKKFASEERLRRHSAIHVTEKAFLCPHCNKNFKRQLTLDIHIRVHTGERPYKCSVCDKAFTQKPHLNNHMLLHTGEKIFECQFCKKSFALKGNLRVHLRLHTGEKPYQCHVCQQGFHDSSARKKHVRSKHGEREVQKIGNEI